jgi:hypothetical protein
MFRPHQGAPVVAPGLDRLRVPQLGDSGVGPPDAITAVQVLGPYNSGTCLMFNYSHHLTTARTRYHLLGWKHSLPPLYAWHDGCLWSEADGGPPEELLRATLVVCMVRCPYFWLLSTAQRSYQIRFEDGATTFSERLRCPVYFSGRQYDNLTAVWNAYYRAYLTHLEPAGAAFVRLEDLVEAPMTIVRALGQHLKLLSSPRLEEEVTRIAATPAKIHQGPCVHGEQARQRYRVDNIQRLISSVDLALIREQIDHTLMAALGYPIVRPTPSAEYGPPAISIGTPGAGKVSQPHLMSNGRLTNANYPPDGESAPSSDGDLLIYLWGISDNEEWIRDNCHWSLGTARKCGLNPQLAGIGYDVRHLERYPHKALARFYVLRDLLDSVSDSRIVLIMDGFDTLFAGSAQQIAAAFRRQKTQILVSAERSFTYQWHEYRDKYDSLSSPYRYPAAGTIIGYAGALRHLTNTCISYIKQGFGHGNDMGLLGKYIYENFETPSFVHLDTNCELFWVTTLDTEVFRRSPLFNPYTKTRPIILHVIGGGRENQHIYRKIGQLILDKEDRLDKRS